MDEKFHSSFLRAIMGLAEILVFFVFFVMQFKAFGTISKVMFNLPPQYEKLYTIVFAIFLSLYTFKGGLFLLL